MNTLLALRLLALAALTTLSACSLAGKNHLELVVFDAKSKARVPDATVELKLRPSITDYYMSYLMPLGPRFLSATTDRSGLAVFDGFSNAQWELMVDRQDRMPGAELLWTRPEGLYVHARPNDLINGREFLLPNVTETKARPATLVGVNAFSKKTTAPN